MIEIVILLALCGIGLGIWAIHQELDEAERLRKDLMKVRRELSELKEDL